VNIGENKWDYLDDGLERRFETRKLIFFSRVRLLLDLLSAVFIGWTLKDNLTVISQILWNGE